MAQKLAKRLPDKAEINVCSACGRIRTREGFFKLDNNTLAVAIKASIHAVDYTLTVASTADNPVRVEFATQVDGKPVIFEKQIALHTDRQRCRECYQKSAGYYEAIFKVHGFDSERVARMADKFKRYIEKKGGFITRVEKTGSGFEVYASDKKAATAFFVSNELKPKRAYNLYGTKHGKKVYRNIYSLTLDQSE